MEVKAEILQIIDKYKAESEDKRNKEYCRNCKWWKDSDGVYRRDFEAESQCPINRKEVYDGIGYCFMFESQERSK